MPLLALATGCGGETGVDGEEDLGALAQPLTRGPWTFEGKPLDAYTHSEAQADFLWNNYFYSAAPSL